MPRLTEETLTGLRQGDTLGGDAGVMCGVEPGESLQQPTWPQVRHSRRRTHDEPALKHSTQTAGVPGQPAGRRSHVRTAISELPLELAAETASISVLYAPPAQPDRVSLDFD